MQVDLRIPTKTVIQVPILAKAIDFASLVLLAKDPSTFSFIVRSHIL